MPKTLAELQASADTGRPTRTFPICVATKLAAELEAADRALFDLESAADAADRKLNAALDAADGQREGGGPPKRLGQGSDVPALKAALEAAEAVASEAAAASDAIRERMKEHEILLHFTHSDEWSQWRAANPPRDEEDDRAGFLIDTRYGIGLCNIDALSADLGRFISAYGDEPATDEAWEFVRNNSALGDRRQAASVVVGMHEQVTDLGKSRAAWRADRKTSNTSE